MPDVAQGSVLTLKPTDLHIYAYLCDVDII